jgi:hypothetical protein
MTSKPDSLYFAERLAAELKALETATNDAARRAHEALVDHYRQQLAACDAAARGLSEASRPAAE